VRVWHGQAKFAAVIAPGGNNCSEFGLTVPDPSFRAIEGAQGGYDASMSLDALASLQGSWQAIYQLRGDPSFEGDSPSLAIIVPLLGGRFVRVDYTWSDRATPQEGSLLIGHEPETGIATGLWIDSWHNGRRMMLCTGTASADGTVDIRGTYPAGPGVPDWGWRTQITCEADSWAMTMWNVTPGGDEALAVRAEYGRA
jgi:Protein of unknown function (DUF1579)